MFPLLYKPIKFYNYKDNMVRSSLRNILLTIFRSIYFKLGNDPKLDKYISSFPFAIYYAHSCCYLVDQWIILDKEISDTNTARFSKIKDYLEDQKDIIYYFNDILDLKKSGLNFVLIHAFLNYSIVPAILNVVETGSNNILKRKWNTLR